MDERRRPSPFSSAALAEQLAYFPPVTRYWIAYSGGCDSHALLHAAAQLRAHGFCAAFEAVHVDHGLQPAAGAWAQHCAAVCAALEIPFVPLRVDARPAPGISPEAAARAARYAAIATLLAPGDCLLTAHHQDDQAETLLLQLLRGGGPHGLAAMAARAPFGAGWHARPLLAFARAELRRYAQQHDLRWIDDPSNADTGFDRNYLRSAVTPLLRARWPALARVLTRSAAHQAEAAQLLDVLAAQDLASCASTRAPRALHIPALSRLDAARQRNLLRYWLKGLGHPLPDSVRLAQIQQTVLGAGVDRQPMVSWQGAEIRRYRDELHALTPSPPIEHAAEWRWDVAAPLHLPGGAQLTAVPIQGSGIKLAACAQRPVTVRYRRGGEHCRPAPQAHLRSLKKMLQEQGMPPWRRERVPLIYVGDELAAVADMWVCAPFHASRADAGLRIEWREAES